MGTLTPQEMATGDQRCEVAIERAKKHEEDAAGMCDTTASGAAQESRGITEQDKVNVDALLALLDPSKAKPTAHIVFIKAQYRPLVPEISDEVRETVDQVGYFALAKALLDCQTDENGDALAVDVVATITRELEIDDAAATAVAMALADSKDLSKRVQVFARKHQERLGQAVDKVMASAAEAKEAIQVKAADTKERVGSKVAEAKENVTTRVEAASQTLQSLIHDDSTVSLSLFSPPSLCRASHARVRAGAPHSCKGFCMHAVRCTDTGCLRGRA